MTYCSTLENTLASGPVPRTSDSPCPNHQPSCSICDIVLVTGKRHRYRSMKPTGIIGSWCQRSYLHHLDGCCDHRTAALELPRSLGKESPADTDNIPRPNTSIKPIFFRNFILSCQINVAGNTARVKSVITLTAGRIGKKASPESAGRYLDLHPWKKE